MGLIVIQSVNCACVCFYNIRWDSTRTIYVEYNSDVCTSNVERLFFLSLSKSRVRCHAGFRYAVKGRVLVPRSPQATVIQTYIQTSRVYTHHVHSMYTYKRYNITSTIYILYMYIIKDTAGRYVFIIYIYICILYTLKFFNTTLSACQW